ncbi:hypothetical protein [Oceanicella actignis]|uniref:Uncharacterized protein n=1 Tax=Oceanicella actignis TaxID=1189325 RepID=A0A1M7TSQ2_9RHOB|nr:hypothetical protein [Oceanicella actignis]SET76384.1 hypothetical protein SAMN04488119_10928 [Oceanicella actignis]SHN73745.1 hypothetical protein SAMN05216200_10994 [Oceanicella actignis]
MPTLSPAPSSLGVFSPALGPWFQRSASDDADLSALPAPGRDLSAARDLPAGAIWNAPAAGLLSFHVVAQPRQAALAGLRAAEGGPAFATGAPVLLFRLLPQVAERLGALSQAAPRPDSPAATTGNQRTRPVIAALALELPADMARLPALRQLLPDNGPADLKAVVDGLSDDDARAAWLGLRSSGGALSDAERPATILRRPEKDERRLLENAGAAVAGAKLWAFTRGGRAFDPGAVAAIWAWLAGVAWDNLWAASDVARQRTAATADARTALLVNAHQGPLAPHLKARLSLSGLTAVDGSDVLFGVGAGAAVRLSAAASADLDEAPIPLVAPLPSGPYAAPDAAAPFAGWSAPGALSRDFLRVAAMDVERHLTGLGREAGSPQADPRLRVGAARNTADPLFLPSADALAAEVMASFAAPGAQVDFMAPELDRDYGPQTPAPLAAVDPFAAAHDDPVATVYAIKGSGRQSGATAEGQSVALRFAGSVPPGAWLRAWPHGRDAQTGRRWRMTGGAALADADGNALLVLPLPDGEAGAGAAPVAFSYDLMIVAAQGARLFADRRAERPPVAAGAPANVASLGAAALFCPETARAPSPGAAEIAPGHTLIAVNGALEDGDFSAVDMTSLRPEDLSASLPNRADADDRLVTRAPAFVQTPPGDLPAERSPGGPERVHDGDFHAPARGQELFDFAAFDRAGGRGVIGAAAGRRLWHEAPPAALGHPGVNAAPEIHAEGLALAGPAADILRLLMRERRPADISEFVSQMGLPFTPAPAPTDPGPWTAVLETAARGTHGGQLFSLIPETFAPGAVWSQIKSQIDAALATLPGGLSVDGIVDRAAFDDDTAAAAFDRVLHKRRNGAQGFARAAMAAIARAEDLVWLQTPALDAERWAAPAGDPLGDVALLEALKTRLHENPALNAVLVLPARHLPDRNARLEEVRKAAVQAALHELAAVAEARVAWVSPPGGPGRPFHSAATTLIVDDAVMFSGAAHAWRRGLVFDSALTGAVFDQNLDFGRPRAVIAARRQLASAMLGIAPDLTPLTGAGLVAALKAQARGGGFGRADTLAYAPGPDATPAPDREIWNPAPSAAQAWTAALAALTGDLRDAFENGVR